MSVVWCNCCGCGPMDADDAEWGKDDEPYCDECASQAPLERSAVCAAGYEEWSIKERYYG